MIPSLAACVRELQDLADDDSLSPAQLAHLQRFGEGLYRLLTYGYVVEWPRCPVCTKPVPQQVHKRIETCSIECRNRLRWQRAGADGRQAIGKLLRGGQSRFKPVEGG